MKYSILIGLFFLFSQFSIWGQNESIVDSNLIAPQPLLQDSVLTDSTFLADTAIVKKGFIGRYFQDWPNPKKAALASLIIPGGGQAYNKRWWKIPIVFASFGGIVYAINYNTKQYKRFHTAWIASINGDPHEFENIGLPTTTLQNTLRNERDRYDKSRQLSYIGIVGVYGLSAMEAFVDAHLMTFDINDDLSFKVKPSIEATPTTISGASIGIGLSFSFHNSKTPSKDFSFP